MGVEIERKFLLSSRAWRAAAGAPVHLVQGYCPTGAGLTVRVRLIGEDRAVLTIKGKPAGHVRSEFEYPIPVEDARAMLKEFCATNVVEKYRYLVPWAGATWEVDEYLGRNEGLFTAEIELESPEQLFERPPWLGMEVSGDPRYSNGSLSRRPYMLWSAEEGASGKKIPSTPEKKSSSAPGGRGGKTL